MLFKNKKNGYYWIQPDCVDKPIRVYCDLNTKLDYYFVQNDEKRNITRRQDIIDVCARKGLFPLEISDDNQIDEIIYYLNDINVDLMTPKAVPLGYDYSCQTVTARTLYNLRAGAKRTISPSLQRNRPLLLPNCKACSTLTIF